jgi:hypothetical protein
MTFVDLCKNGKIKKPLDEIDNFIDKWHNDLKTDLELYEYLGLSLDEYNLFINNSKALIDILNNKK